MGPRKHRPAGTAAPDSLEQVSRLIASIEELKATLEAHLSADHPSAPETAGSAAHTTDVVYPTP